MMKKEELKRIFQDWDKVTIEDPYVREAVQAGYRAYEQGDIEDVQQLVCVLHRNLPSDYGAYAARSGDGEGLNVIIGHSATRVFVLPAPPPGPVMIRSKFTVSMQHATQYLTLPDRDDAPDRRTDEFVAFEIQIPGVGVVECYALPEIFCGALMGAGRQPIMAHFIAEQPKIERPLSDFSIRYFLTARQGVNEAGCGVHVTHTPSGHWVQASKGNKRHENEVAALRDLNCLLDRMGIP